MRRSSLSATLTVHRPAGPRRVSTGEYGVAVTSRRNILRRRPNPDADRVVSPPVSALAVDDPHGADDVGDALSARRVRTDFDVIFDAHYERLVRALTLVAGDAETAADAVQEAFVKAHLRWRRISRYDDPVGWVRRVAINQLRDDHRRRGRKQRALAKLASREPAFATQPELDEFDRLLAELPKQQRATTALFYVDGLTVAEIAVALDIAEGSVKSHLHDARQRLRPVLEREAGRSPGPGDRT
jgi:RNA polymerase sigma-70 factor, ECF subfamily